jgi:hypothetical protein
MSSPSNWIRAVEPRRSWLTPGRTKPGFARADYENRRPHDLNAIKPAGHEHVASLRTQTAVTLVCPSTANPLSLLKSE